MFWQKEWDEADRGTVPVFVSLYDQSLPMIKEIIESSGDAVDRGNPVLSRRAMTSVVDASARLAPMLEACKRIPNPKGRVFSKTKADFQLVLDTYVRLGELMIKRHMDVDVLRPTFVFQTTFAFEVVKGLAQRMPVLVERYRRARWEMPVVDVPDDKDFHAYVGRQLSSMLPYRRKAIIFGPTVCERAAVNAMSKSGFFVGAALGLANRSAAVHALAEVTAPEQWEAAFEPLTRVFAAYAADTDPAAADYDAAFADGREGAATRGDLLSPVECRAIVTQRVLFGLLWGVLFPEVVLSMLEKWLAKPRESQDLGVGGLRIQEHPLLESIEQAYEASYSLYRSWRQT